ncbi:MAG TPA: alkaline phosphatase family protein [Thermoanaerobaculia bacterium]|nr:alkaline phosphatase family protein [Thermoanaerobaculia bacterium]
MQLPRLSVLLCSLTLGFLLAGCGQDRGRVVLIGVDGGSWNLIDPMVKAGQMPNFKAIMDRGVSADLASVEPFLSPPVWTSIATSRTPKAHGVTSFYVNRYAIKVPTIWDRLAGGGLRVGLYDYLVTWPPRHFPNGGFSVPGWLRRDDSVWPPDLFQRIGLPAYAYAVVDLGGPDQVVANAEREVREKPRYWNRLWEELQPDVGAVTFYALDVVSHRFWSTDVDPRSSDVLPRTARGVDRAIGEIVAGLGPEDNVLIASDHGFQVRPEPGRTWGFDARGLLAGAGFDPQREKLTILSGFGGIFVRLDPGPAAEREATLDRLRSFFATIRSADGAEAFRPVTYHMPPRPSEVEEPKSLWMSRMIEDKVAAYALLAAEVNQDVFERMVREGHVLIGKERIPVGEFTSAHDFVGTHSMVGIFLAAGKAIRHQPRRLRLSVLDVAPLMMYLAGQPIPDDMEGRFQRALIDPAYLARHPPGSIQAAKAPRLPDEHGAQAVEDAETNEKLRALGYIQ